MAMSKAVLSVRLDPEVIETFDSLAYRLGKTRSRLLSDILCEYAAQHYQARVDERLAISQVNSGEGVVHDPD